MRKTYLFLIILVLLLVGSGIVYYYRAIYIPNKLKQKEMGEYEKYLKQYLKDNGKMTPLNTCLDQADKTRQQALDKECIERNLGIHCIVPPDVASTIESTFIQAKNICYTKYPLR